MIKLIGFKRIVFLACLLAINLSALGIYFFSIGPMLDDVTAQKDQVDGQIKELHAKIASAKQDMAYLKDHLAEYNSLKDSGLFLNQDRFMISHIMEGLRAKEGLSSFAFSVADIKDIPNTDADAVNYKLIDSRITVSNIVSPLDTSAYILAQDIVHAFPGFARIQDLKVTRVADVDERSLKDLSNGQPVNFVSSTLDVDWITMVPKTTDAAPGAAPTPTGFRRQ